MVTDNQLIAQTKNAGMVKKTVVFLVDPSIRHVAGNGRLSRYELKRPRPATLANDGVAAVFSRNELIPIAIAFVRLGLFPLIVRFAMKYLKRTPEQTISA